MKKQKLAIVILLLFAFFYFSIVYAQDDGIVLFKDSINNVEIATTTTIHAIEDTAISSAPIIIHSKNQERNFSNNTSTNTANSDLLWEGTIENSNASGTISASPFSQAFSYLTYIALLIIIMFITSYILQKKGLIKRNAYGKVISIIPLDTKRIIYITEIIGKYYILGVTEHSINKIDEVSNEEMIKLIKLTDKKPENSNITFEKMLKETSVIPITTKNENAELKNKETNKQMNKEHKPIDPTKLEALKALISKKE